MKRFLVMKRLLTLACVLLARTALGSDEPRFDSTTVASGRLEGRWQAVSLRHEKDPARRGPEQVETALDPVMIFRSGMYRFISSGVETGGGAYRSDDGRSFARLDLLPAEGGGPYRY